MGKAYTRLPLTGYPFPFPQALPQRLQPHTGLSESLPVTSTTLPFFTVPSAKYILPTVFLLPPLRQLCHRGFISS